MDSASHINIWVERVIDRWLAHDVKLEPGAALNDIAKAESYLSFIFPDTFKALYKKCNGFRGFDWNVYMFSFWSLERIIQEYDPKRLPNFIGFCDFLISSHFIGFYNGQVGIFKQYYNLAVKSEPEKIADDFDEAVDLINSSADIIY